jgi:DNA-binding IclR family transcriptional regulator
MNDFVKSAARVLDILELLSVLDEPAGVSEVARSLGIPKSSAAALLETLLGRGYLAREGTGYRLAPPLRQGSWVGGEFAHLIRLVHPVMAGAVARTGESAFLGVRTPNWAIRYVDKVVSPKEVRYDGGLSHERPAYCTSVGQVLLAAEPDAVVEKYLATVPLVRVTPATVVRPDDIRAILRQVRERGYAESRNGHVEGASGVAAPIRGPSGRIIAAITLAAPSTRFDEMYATMLCETLRAAEDATKALRGMSEHIAAEAAEPNPRPAPSGGRKSTRNKGLRE